MTNEEAKNWLNKLYIGADITDEYGDMVDMQPYSEAVDMAIEALEKTRWIPVSDKYEHHIDHTDCIWYGNDSGCPTTCSQYRDGWNDAMDYIFKNGDGYRPYRRE